MLTSVATKRKPLLSSRCQATVVLLCLKASATVSALKPGWVTWVMFCPGHPGQICFKNYPGLDHVGCEIKKTQYGGAATDATATFVYFVSHTHFFNDICWLQMHREPNHLFCVQICMQQSIFKACTEPHPSIHCCCRTSRVLPLPSARQRILFIACIKPLPLLQAMILSLQAYK